MADTYHRVSPRIIDESLMQDDKHPLLQPQTNTSAQTVAPVEQAGGNWFSNMSMNKKIALCIIVAVIIIFILVLVVRYYNSQPVVQPQMPPMPPQQCQRQQIQPQQVQQAQVQPQQVQQAQVQQAQVQPQQVQPHQVQQAQVQPQQDSISKSEALEALKAMNAQPENVVGRSIDDINQFMSDDIQAATPTQTSQTQLNDYNTINDVNNNNTSEDMLSESEYCNAVTAAGKQCRNRIKANGKCHLHLD